MIKEITREWLEKNNACQSGINDWKKENDHETITTIKRNIERNPKQANWIITKVMNEEQNKKYSLFAALQVFPLWEKKYPKQAAIWKKWADNHANYATATAADAAAYAAYAAASDAAIAAIAAIAATDAADAAAYAAYAAAAYAATAAIAATDAADAAAYAATATAADAAIAATDAADAAAAVYAVYAADTCNNDMIVKILNYGLSLLLTE
jgi:hypothetical protein